MKFREKYFESLVSTKKAFKDVGMHTTYLSINYPAILFEVLNANSNNKPCDYGTVAKALSITYSSSHRLCRILAGKISMTDGSKINKPLLQISKNNPVSIDLTMEGRHFLAVVYDIFDDVREDIPIDTGKIAADHEELFQELSSWGKLKRLFGG